MKTAICRKNTGSVMVDLYKDHTYSFERLGLNNMYDYKVYNNLGRYVYFFEAEFKEFFIYKEKDIRKYKLNKLNKLNESR